MSGSASWSIVVRSVLLSAIAFGSAGTARSAVDFNRDIRPILSNNCYMCHGPDEKERQGDLRLDTEAGSRQAVEGRKAIVPGKPEASELLKRVSAVGGKAMPPTKTGKKLTPREIDLLTQWIREGAGYARHWSYEPVRTVEVPSPKTPGWTKNPIDRFILHRLEAEKLNPSAEADRRDLARRAALDITGLPPTLAEVREFLADSKPDAFDRYVDRLLQKDSFGEHWARMWLDLARYADSAGYADDPARTIWGYRDYVIRSFNANKRFNRFTIEQIAGDLLENPTDEQLVATAFNRNTMTNNEGGTNDEEFRNVAVVDRVNTTLTTWMGVSIACAQCHNHKYDPISQKEYFQLFAFLNNTADADRPNEAPVLELLSEAQRKQRTEWQAERDAIEKRFGTPSAKALAGLSAWQQKVAVRPVWSAVKPVSAKTQSGNPAELTADGSILVAKSAKADVHTIELPVGLAKLSGLRIDTLPDEKLPGRGPGHAGGNFVVTKVSAVLIPNDSARPIGRYLRVSLPGPNRMLSLAEVQVFSGGQNVALKGKATQSSTDYDGPPQYAIDGKTDGHFEKKSVTHTRAEANPWWEVDLTQALPVDRLMIWNRTDGNVGGRLADFNVELLDANRKVVWSANRKTAPNPSMAIDTGGSRPVTFRSAAADYEQSGFPASAVLSDNPKKTNGWAIGGATGSAHHLTLALDSATDVPAGSKLVVTIEQKSSFAEHTLGRYRISLTPDAAFGEWNKLPSSVTAALTADEKSRTEDQRKTLVDYYVRNIAPETQADRDRSAALTKMMTDLKPTTVPVMKELTGAARRKTRLQFRGNFMDLGDEVSEGIPAIFPQLPKGTAANRLAFANWLVSPENPLTARVTVNRFWEQIFGIGLVRTSEEFGIQGELPSHPELLDWLAGEFVRGGWDMKALVKLLVTSATYRQSSKVTKTAADRDPENRLLARGPRVRLTAEMIRDQALAVSGLLSSKMYGASVKPPQPAFGLNAAFGRSMDWTTSDGEDRYRRGLYTEWRRTNPYPSMSTFDAPNRDVCTVRRNRTNTPLQALVTLNDPVYVEAAQALARRSVQDGGATPAERIRHAFEQSLLRPPTDRELSRLVAFYEETRSEYAKQPAKAADLAGKDAPKTALPETAAMTVVANVLLNLDEMLMKR